MGDAGLIPKEIVSMAETKFRIFSSVLISILNVETVFFYDLKKGTIA